MDVIDVGRVRRIEQLSVLIEITVGDEGEFLGRESFSSLGEMTSYVGWETGKDVLL